MAAVTQPRSFGGFTGRRYGSFAGKAEASPIVDATIAWASPPSFADWTAPTELIDFTSPPLLADWTTE